MAARRTAAALALAAWLTLAGAPGALGADPNPSPSPDPQQRCQAVDPRIPPDVVARLGCDLLTGGPAGPARDISSSGAEAARQAGQGIVASAESDFSAWLAAGAAWIAARSSLKPSASPAQRAAKWR